MPNQEKDIIAQEPDITALDVLSEEFLSFPPLGNGTSRIVISPVEEVIQVNNTPQVLS